MQKIEIEGELDISCVIALIAEGYDTYQILKNYELSEELILQCVDLLDKEVLVQGFIFSENFIRTCLENEFIVSSDIEKMNMGTYARLSNDFVEEYSHILNWNRILVYLSTQTNSFTNYVSIIDEKNLWSLISANDLPIDFIREYREKLDWNLLYMTKCFNEDEIEEFQHYIVEVKGKHTQEQIKSSNVDFMSEVDQDYSIDDITDIINKYMADNNRNFIK